MSAASTEPNWLLFYQVVDDVVTGFAELVRLDDKLLLRTGKLLTWGISEDVSDFDAVRGRLLNEGYICARRWHFDPAVFDVERFSDELLHAARTAFMGLRQQHPALDAFCLQTDDGAMTIAAVAHVVGDFDSAADDVIGNPSAWTVHDDSTTFDVVYRLILSQHRDDLSLVGFDHFRAAFDAAVVDVLEALSAAGAFGDDADRRIVVFDVTDSEIDDTLLLAQQRLNSPTVFQRWRAAMGASS